MACFQQIQEELLTKIYGAKSSLKVAVAWFTNHELFDALLEKLSQSDFQLDLIVLNDRINNKTEGIPFQKLIEKGANFYFSGNENLVHHKFCIVDDELVITGSYNWTYYTEKRNWENVVVITDKEEVQSFVDEFNKITSAHERIFDVEKQKRLSADFNSTDYLVTDYLLQAEVQQRLGYDLNAARIYTELYRMNQRRLEVSKERKRILEKYNLALLEIAPFEIGLLFKNGYSKQIPAYAALPCMSSVKGATVGEGQQQVRITIQKRDLGDVKLGELPVYGLMPSPKGTYKIEVNMELKPSGYLEIYCKEIGGNNRVASTNIDVRPFIA